MNRSESCLLAMLIVGLVALPAAAQLADNTQPTAQTHVQFLRAQNTVPVRDVPSVDRVAVAEQDAAREAAGLAPRFAIPNLTFLDTEDSGVWEEVDASTSVWRMRIASAGAYSLNIGFGRYKMTENGRLLVYSADGAQVVRPFTAQDNAAHGELWTPVVLGEELVLEVTLPTAEKSELGLEIQAINVGYRGFGDPTPLSGSCNIDVVCPEGNAWRDEIPSVAVISTGGSLFCTGFMVNNTAQDQTPYFMTAYHCGISSGNAASLVAYWNYETTPCGGTPNGSLGDFQTGSFFRSRYSPSDFTLVELDSAPDPAWGVTFAGWDRSGLAPNAAIAIHHPSVDEKRISFENDPTSTTSYLNNAVPGNGTHIRVTDWDLGTTEPGSSGSPLFDPNHRVVGQLHGGYASCSSQTSDWYGKFSVSWNGGGTSSSRLSNWLDPGGTGTTKVDTLVPGGCNNNSECDDGLFCNGAETCVSNTCQGGSDPCPGQGCDEGLDACFPLVCNNDGTCDSGEDCNNCGNDCISGSSGTGCNNDGVCEPAAGEDCVSCPNDCAGKQNGNPSGRYCCGDGDGAGPVGCGDSRCTSGGFMCSNDPRTGYCCGDTICEGAEDSFNCAVDCGAPPFCGDASCDPGEDSCNCAADCGNPPANETGLCTDGVDNDCDTAADCADLDCSGDQACQPGACDNDGVCEAGEDCSNCSNDCDSRQNGRPSNRYCCGNGVQEGPEGDGRCDGNF